MFLDPEIKLGLICAKEKSRVTNKVSFWAWSGISPNWRGETPSNYPSNTTKLMLFSKTFNRNKKESYILLFWRSIERVLSNSLKLKGNVFPQIVDPETILKRVQDIAQGDKEEK